VTDIVRCKHSWPLEDPNVEDALAGRHHECLRGVHEFGDHCCGCGATLPMERTTAGMIRDLYATASWIALPYPGDSARTRETADRMAKLLDFHNAVVAAVAERDAAYARREHGGVANDACVDSVQAAIGAYVAATDDTPL